MGLSVSAGLACADEQNPTNAELDGATFEGYQWAFANKFDMPASDIAIDAMGLGRIRARFVEVTNRRQATNETFFAAYRRTARDLLASWMTRDGNDNTKWLLERFHPLQCFADGSRTNRNADMDFAVNMLLKRDKHAIRQLAERGRIVHETAVHEAGRRTVPKGVINYAALIPKSVQRELGVPS